MMHTQNTVMDALKRRAFEEASELLKKGEKLPPQIEAFTLRQIISQAIDTKSFAVIDHFIKEDLVSLDIYEYDSFNNTLFETIVKRNDWDEASLQWLNELLSHAENLNDELQDITLLGYAFENGADMAVIKALLTVGCDLHYKNNAEENFIFQVVNNNHISIEKSLNYLSLLIDEGLTIDQQNIIGHTALMAAVARRKTAIMEFLLQNGAQANLPDKSGNTAFSIAVVDQLDLNLYNLLATFDSPDFEHKNKGGESLLLGYLRMMYNDSPAYLKLLERLLDDGADLYQTAPYYNQEKGALDWITEKSVNILELVLSKDLIDINQPDNKGNTLLHKICAFDINFEKDKAKDLYRKVKLLLEKGADPSLLNDEDKTAADLASNDNLKSKSVELLLTKQLQ